MCRCFHFNAYFEGRLLLHFHYPLGFRISWSPYSPSYSDQPPSGVLGCSWRKGEQLHTFSCSVYTVLWSLASQHSNYKGNIKWCQTYLILLNFLAVPRLSETLAAKAQGSSFAVSLESAPRLCARYAKFHMVVCFLLTAVVWTLCSMQSWFSTSFLCFLSYKHYLQILSLPHQRADFFMSANLFQSILIPANSS